MLRMKKRVWNNNREIEQFLQSARTGSLGLSDSHQPYVVPLNFVYMNHCIYFHCAAEGRKNKIMSENASVCFTVSEEFGTMTSAVPAHTDTAYNSVIIFGKAMEINDLEEATEVMQRMLDKYVPGFYSSRLPSAHVEKYKSSLGSKTAVFQISIEEISGKQNILDSSILFEPGKKVTRE